MLKKLKIKNYKSFKNFEIELDKFNCIVAPNNAGKSNLIDSFRFLQYVFINPQKAIEEFGGFDNIKNIFLDDEKIVFEVDFFIDKIILNTAYIEDDIKEYIEVFKNLEIKVLFEVDKNRNWNKKYIIKGNFAKKLTLKNIKTFPFYIEINYLNLKSEDKEFVKKELLKIKYKDKDDLLYALRLPDLIDNNSSIFIGDSDIFNLSDYFYSYSFYPEIIKTHLKGGRVLRFDGTNLVEVLNFLKNSFNFEEISNSLIGIVEELDDIKIDKDLIDRNILLLKEKNKFLPFNIVSDGTINLLAILTSIYEPFEKKMISFDELEKHLHLRAIDYILEVLKSQTFQVTFTTQSTEILNNLDLRSDNLIFLYRDYEGFTKGINSKKIPNFNKKVKRYKDISTIIRNEVLGYLGDFDEN